MSKKSFLVAALFLSFSFIQSDKVKISADEKASSIVYFMSHPLHDWDATAKSFKTIIVYDKKTKEINTVAAVAKVQSFDSGNSNRDSHAVEVLEALKYPNITFTSNDIKQNGESLTINGNLNFHGVTKPIVVAATRKDTGQNMTITGKMNIKMTDYGIEPPSLMSIATKDNIRIDFTMSFKL